MLLLPSTSENEKINVYPCGIVMSPYASYMAWDRRVYNPDRDPHFGLLEVKYPVASSYLELPYLVKINQDTKSQTQLLLPNIDATCSNWT